RKGLHGLGGGHAVPHKGREGAGTGGSVSSVFAYGMVRRQEQTGTLVVKPTGDQGIAQGGAAFLGQGPAGRSRLQPAAGGGSFSGGTKGRGDLPFYPTEGPAPFSEGLVVVTVFEGLVAEPGQGAGAFIDSQSHHQTLPGIV